MDQIYHVSSATVSKLNLWKETDGRFRVIEFGEFVPLLDGGDYILIDKKFVSAFDSLLKNEVEIKPVSIYRMATGDEWNNYSQLIIHQSLNPDNIQTTNTNAESI